MKQIIAALLFATVISGCTSKMAYNNLDWLVYWYTDDYVELSDEQEAIFDPRLKAMLSWHRTEELPRYQQQLVELKRQLNSGPLSAEQVSNQFVLVTQHWQRLRNTVVAELSSMAHRMTDEQVKSLFAELAHNNKERADERAKKNLSDEESMQDRTDDILDDVKEWTGKLSVEQKEIIADYASHFISNEKLWAEYRVALQDKIYSLLERREDSAEFVAELSALLTHPEQFRSEQLVAINRHNRALYSQMVSDISATLSAKQKRHVNRELDSIIDDITDLLEE